MPLTSLLGMVCKCPFRLLLLQQLLLRRVLYAVGRVSEVAAAAVHGGWMLRWQQMRRGIAMTPRNALLQDDQFRFEIAFIASQCEGCKMVCEGKK